MKRLRTFNMVDNILGKEKRTSQNKTRHHSPIIISVYDKVLQMIFQMF